ncbi:transposase [Kamptonema formosum]|uniref:transposase n=1 Tax=Kamptonema formosum TaxID=331992 RepID=UPI0018E244A1
MSAAGAKVIYLSPYSPDFNPIENLGSKLKEYLRSVGVRTREALEVAIKKGLDMITLKDLESGFTHCSYCTSPD